MTAPRVSVLLPVHDAEATLAEALACLRAQTLEAWEGLVVLNGVTDRSGEIARRAAAADPRLRVLERPEAGLVAALNAGLDAARAPLLARFDADDLMDPARLAAQAAALDSEPGWSAVTCGVRCSAVGGGEAGAGMRRHVAWLNGLDTPAALRAARFVDAPVAHPAVMARTDVLRAAGGYREGDFPEDHELWLRLMAAGHAFGRVAEVLVDWRDRPDRLTRTDPRLRDKARRRLVHRYLLAGPLAGGRGCLVWGAGPYGRKHARGLSEAGARVEALLDIDPRKIGREVAGGLPVRPADALGGPDGRLVLVAVASRGARELIAASLAERGHVLERDWLPVQ